jgi:ubiquinone/menaquinone biosynthesis C-methylase UbiE
VSDARSRYEQWLRRIHGPAHARRTAERNAQFFLPHLRPGMRLLDAGCGPGSITIGLAEAVADCEAIGIDVSEEAIEAARATASSLGRDNLRFAVADIGALPFEDESFDGVFCHAVFQHLRDRLEGLRELRRVMRPGGVIGVADADLDGSLMASADPALDAAGRLLHERRAPELREYAIELGLASDVELDEMSDAWHRWSGSPGAFWARFWCQAIGWAG